MSENVGVDRLVIVLGGHMDAVWVVEELCALDYEVIWVWTDALPDVPMISRCTTYPNSRLLGLTGHAGGFTLRIRSADQQIDTSASAIVIATGNEREFTPEQFGLKPDPRIISTRQLYERLAVPRQVRNLTTDRRQHILFALDLVGLSGKEATVETLQLALQTRQTWHCEVSVLYSELQVDSDLLESLTRQMRALGIIFHRLTAEKPVIDEHGVSVNHADGSIQADVLVLPESVQPRKDNHDLAGLLQLTLGTDGYIQELNVHFYRPGLSNRKGIFLAGRCHLDTDAAGAHADAMQAAANVDALLHSGWLLPEDVIAHVASDKCIRCLTCIRTCPHIAVELARYEQVTAARVVDVACRGCGACVANCPVQAIELIGSMVPAWLQTANVVEG
ncbi:MAG: 4Fe-4S dicluster-binding protein [Anaerolineae bacterium]